MDEATIRAMQSLASEVWRQRPELVNEEVTMGQLAWQWASGHRRQADSWNHRVWADGATGAGRTLAFGWTFAPMEAILSESERRTAPARLIWQTRLDKPELLDDVLDWFASVVPSDTPGASARRTAARAVDLDAQDRLQRHGYVRDDPEAPWGMLNVRDLDDIEEPALPTGYRALTMRELNDDANGLARRVDVHRAAWAPSNLTVEAYQDVMRTPPYRDDLDFVIESDNGTLVASAIGWYDEANHVAEFEPVGTHPDYRRRGLGRALSLFGMQRFRDAGAQQAIVGCRGDDNYPIPKKLYRSVGFRELTRELRFVKE